MITIIIIGNGIYRYFHEWFYCLYKGSLNWYFFIGYYYVIIITIIIVASIFTVL